MDTMYRHAPIVSVAVKLILGVVATAWWVCVASILPIFESSAVFHAASSRGDESNAWIQAAQPSCDASRPGSAIGIWSGITCVGLTPEEHVAFYWDVAAGTPFATEIATWNGRAVAIFEAPEGLTGGPHHLIAVGEISKLQIFAPFAIFGKVRVGISTITISGFGAQEHVAITWEPEGENPVALGFVSVNGRGVGSIAFTSPARRDGVYTVSAIGESTGLGAETVYYVQSTICVGPGGSVSATQRICATAL